MKLVLALVLFALAACSSPPHSAMTEQRDASLPDAKPPRDGAAPPRAPSSAPQHDAATPARAAAPAPRDAGTREAPDAVSAAASHGGTITFQGIGAAGWYPSRRDPASGDCSAYRQGSCCMSKHEVTGDALTPWDEDLIMTLRGPIVAQQLAVYQPRSAQAAEWTRVANWDARDGGAASGIAFDGDATKGAAFAGTVGDQCLVDVMSDREFPCGPGSEPYCPAPAPGHRAGQGWSGSKLVVLLSSMPHDGDGTIAPAQDCSDDASGNWHDAPWIGFSLGELVRAGKFGDCHCYAKDPAQWWLADGCGQLNAFEVVNDNNDAKNLDVFSSNFFGYQGYIGEGPCGSRCDVGALDPAVDLVDKASRSEAQTGAVASPSGGPGAAFRRPAVGTRYFLILFDVASRSVQLAIISPHGIPPQLNALLPDIPAQLPATTISALVGLRLPS